MTPSKYIKSQGLPSLAFVAKEAGVNARTLHNWFHDKNKLFKVVVAGVMWNCPYDVKMVVRSTGQALQAINAALQECGYERERE